MKATLESTTKVVSLNGVPARIWEGQTESGIKILCFITRVAIDSNEERTEEFEKEVSEQRAPSPEVEAFPLRLII